MPNCYIEVTAVDYPFEFDIDDNERTIFSTNFDVTAVGPNDDFEESIVEYLQGQGIPLVLGVDTFIGAAATIPTDDGPYTFLISTSGIGTLETHNSNRLERPGLQVLVRGKPSPVARQLALDIWRELDGARNIFIP